MAQSRVVLPKWVSVVRSNPAAYERDVFSQAQFSTPADVVRFIGPTLRRSEVEIFVTISLDSQHRPIGATKVTSGILNSSLVHPREVFRTAIVMGASAIIAAHNHPSGDPTPSADDKAVTEQLLAAGRILDIPLFDHIIVAGDRFVSFGASGIL